MKIIVGILSSVGLIKFFAMVCDLIWLFGCLIVLGFIVLKFDK